MAHLMTFTKRKYFNYGFYTYQTKASNPGNTVAATNPVFDQQPVGSYSFDKPN